MSAVISEARRHRIRKAESMDISKMVNLGYRLCDKTIYRELKRDRPSIVHTFTRAMNSQFGCAFVAEHDGEITGILVGWAQEIWWSKDRYATDLIFYSERAGDGLKLLKEFIKWAWSTPRVVEITMGQSSGRDIEKMDALYKRVGLQKVGGLYSALRSPK